MYRYCGFCREAVATDLAARCEGCGELCHSTDARYCGLYDDELESGLPGVHGPVIGWNNVQFVCLNCVDTEL